MILKGKQRGGSKQLAIHLQKTEDNEHVEIHEVRGFASNDLNEALYEAYAISRGTRCKQFLYSLSLNPPENETVPIKVFEKAIANIEERLKLSGQPPVIVFHEKEGRRHAHCVWSRIDGEEMRAINIDHDRLKLKDMSRKLYIEHGWKMPQGFVKAEERDPLNFTRAQWQQAKRIGRDPRAIKTMFQDCWAISDSGRAFAEALRERGYHPCQGDRRGHVAVDHRGEIYAIAKWVGVRAKEVKARLGEPDDLPSVAVTKAKIAKDMTGAIHRHMDDADKDYRVRKKTLETRRLKLVNVHRTARWQLHRQQESRQRREVQERATMLPRGLKAVWFWLTGRYMFIREAMERDARLAAHRDAQERQALIDEQLAERRRLQREIKHVRRMHVAELTRLYRDVAEYQQLGLEDDQPDNNQVQKRRRRRRRTDTPVPSL